MSGRLVALRRGRALAAAAACGILVLMALARPVGNEAGNARHIMLLYVGADDCAACRAWHGKQLPSFAASTAFARLEFREVRSKSLTNVLDDDNWPQDLREYREPVAAAAGVPLWLIVSDGELLFQGAGLGEWEMSVRPRIERLLR